MMKISDNYIIKYFVKFATMDIPQFSINTYIIRSYK